MTTATVDERRAVPWHFWLVSALAVLWNAYGAYDYLMSNTKGDDYFRSMGATDAMIAYMHAYPTWMIAVWAIGVWSSVLATILLLLRRRWAFEVFAVSIAAIVVSLVYQYGMTNGAQVAGPVGMVMNAAILIAAIFFAWYARAMTKAGLLR